MRVIELEPKKTINGYTKYNPKKKYNFKALTVPDYLNVLPGFKKEKKDGSYLCHCPLDFNHPNNDETPSLLISKGENQVVVYCQSHGGGNGHFNDGVCTQKEILKWFNRQFKLNGTLDRIRNREQIQFAKDNNLLRTVPESEYRAKGAEVKNRNLLFKLDLADALYGEYDNLTISFSAIITLVRAGFTNEYIAKELDLMLQQHATRVFKAKIKEKERQVIKTKSKEDLIDDFFTAQHDLALYQAHDGTHPYDHFNNIDPEKDCYE